MLDHVSTAPARLPDPARRSSQIRSQRKRSPRDRRRSGNVMLEMVFTILPTFALIFAFVDFGLFLFRWSTLQNAVREGCRYAITFQTSGALGQDASIQQVVQQNSMGLLATADTQGQIKVNYYAPSNLTAPIPAASGGNVPGNLVEVSVQGVSWAQLAPLSGTFIGSSPVLRSTNPIQLNVYSSDILGGYPAGVSSVSR